MVINLNETKTREEWIKISKTLCIIDVVVGHAIGQFNMYIYQFLKCQKKESEER